MVQHPLRLVGLASLLAAASCSGSPAKGTCNAGLLAGDLVITEFMADPASSDTGKEWFEIYNRADRQVSLSTLQIVVSKDTGATPKNHVVSRLTLGPKQYLVLGDRAEAGKPDWLGYSYGDDLGALPSENGAITLKCNDAVIDRISWIKVGSNVSRSLNGGKAPDAAVNNDLSEWCDATTQFGVEFKGTPGSANDPCTAGLCRDPLTSMLRPIVAPAVGDLVITEVMGNPVTTEADGEWIEITAAKAVDLAGLSVGDTADATRMRPVMEAAGGDCLPIGMGERAVLVTNLSPMMNGGIAAGPRVFTLPALMLNNSSDYPLSIGLGTGAIARIVDTIPETPAAKTEGVSLALHADHENAKDNDERRYFCAGTAAYGPGGKGTPGGANAQCIGAGQCRDPLTRMVRPIVAPAVGDLVITEVMGNPATTEADGEWIEITAAKAVDLAALSVGDTADATKMQAVMEAASGDCLPIGVGERAVLVTNLSPLLNGGIAAGPRVFTLPALMLNNSSDYPLSIGHGAGASARIVDTIPETPAAKTEGVSLALHPDHENAKDNDERRYYCAATAVYGPGGKGTPGGANAKCDLAPTPGNCREGGVERVRRVPALGYLELSEIMPDPDLASDADGEWFEIKVNKATDLNGLTFGTSSKQTIPEGTCISVSPGDHVVFARNLDPLQNGDLKGLLPWQLITGGSFVNGGGTITLEHGMVPLDMLTWPASKAGVAHSHDPNPPNNWCNLDPARHAKERFNGTDYGTPGAVNTSCP